MTREQHLEQALAECLSRMGWVNLTDDELRHEIELRNGMAAIILRARSALPLLMRLRHAMTTMQNDDLSKPQSDKRARHIERYDALSDIAEFLERQAASVERSCSDPHCKDPNCNYDNHPAPAVERDSYTKGFADGWNAVERAEVAGEVVAWRIHPDDTLFLRGATITDEKGVAESWERAGNRIEPLGVITYSLRSEGVQSFEVLTESVPAVAKARTFCPNGLEHGNCLHPNCVSSCPGRLDLAPSASGKTP